MNNPPGSLPDFGIVENIEIAVRAELDKKTISFPDLIKLEPGSILEFSRPTGENVDVYLEKVLLGNAEILVVESKLAVRICDLFSRNGVKKVDGF